MTKVRIVGGSLTGVLAAFEAHRLGCRDIELHEQADRLGGFGPRAEAGPELANGCFKFGTARDPIRSVLEWHGVAFDEFEDACGAVSPGPDGRPLATPGFEGPALPARSIGLAEPTGETLADRLRAYPADMQPALVRHCQWRLGGAWLDEVHASAAAALGIERVLPAGGDVSTLTDLRHTDELYHALYAAPRGAGVAAQPRGGLEALYDTCRRRLETLGVAIHTGSAVTPRAALSARRETTVWAADPGPLFKAAGLAAPRLMVESYATYAWKAKFAGPVPLRIQNFTAEGAIHRLCFHESRGETLVAAHCVAEASDGELRREVHRLMAGFGGDTLALGEAVSTRVEPRRIYGTMAAVEGLKALRVQVAGTRGAGFVLAPLDRHHPQAAMRVLSADLAQAISRESPAAEAA